jgi:hypothetical protein
MLISPGLAFIGVTIDRTNVRIGLQDWNLLAILRVYAKNPLIDMCRAEGFFAFSKAVPSAG